MEKSNALTVPTKQLELAKKLDTKVFQVLGDGALLGFERAFTMASAIAELDQLLTAEYMAPIMKLQGSKIGFKTDRDANGGYPEATVKKCLIEAVLMGLQPTGNEMNIIAGNTYATKEGMGSLLKNLSGLQYDIVFELPRMNDKSAAVKALINWNYNGVIGEKAIDLAIRVNAGMGADAVIGKATRKARHWLHSTLTGSEIGEADVQDIDYKDVTGSASAPIDKQKEQIISLIDNAKTTTEMNKFVQDVPEDLKDLFWSKHDTLKAGE